MLKTLSAKLGDLKTLPNKLTVARVVLIPFILFIYPLTHQFVFMRIFCAALFVLAAVTDFFDGYLARRYNNTSRLGALLDPMADKLLVAATTIVLVGAGSLPAFLGGLVICREIAVSAMRLAALERGQTIAVKSLGKWKMLSQSVAFFCLLISTEFLATVGLVAIWVAILLAYYSAYLYWTEFWAVERDSFLGDDHDQEETPAED